MNKRLNKGLVAIAALLALYLLSIHYTHSNFLQKNDSGRQALEDKLTKLVKESKPKLTIDLAAACHNFTKTKQDNDVSSPVPYLQKYPYLLNCKHDYLKLKPEEIKHVDEEKYQNSFNYMSMAPNETHELRILRAVVIYFPMGSVDHFKSEFKWMYRSWIHMQTYEPKKWRTDLIMFIDTSLNQEIKKPEFFLNEMNCSISNMRTKPEQSPMCTLINYKAVKDRKEPAINKNDPRLNDKSTYQHLLHQVDIFSPSPADTSLFLSLMMASMESYGYLDSILMAYDGYQYFKSAGYDFLIRSDMDVFLTPALATWLPRYCNDFYVGGGAYSNTFNRKRLNRIANDLSLKHGKWSNLGSTWISTPEQFRLISYLTLIGMAYLAREEFTEPERKGQVGTINWPEWHYGVLLLYGQNLALNHLIGSDQINVVRLHNFIDYPSGNTNSIFSILHIHVFHGDQMFSKFSFKMGKYNNESLSDYDPKNQTTWAKYDQVKFYALRMALEGQRINGTDLFKLLVSQTSNKA